MRGYNRLNNLFVSSGWIAPTIVDIKASLQPHLHLVCKPQVCSWSLTTIVFIFSVGIYIMCQIIEVFWEIKWLTKIIAVHIK